MNIREGVRGGGGDRAEGFATRVSACVCVCEYVSVCRWMRCS